MLSDGTFNYTYDAEGNCTSRTRISNSPADDYTTVYTWDYRDRLTSVTFKDNSGNVTKTVTYTYDAFNRWIGETIVGGQHDATDASTSTTARRSSPQFDKTGAGNLAATDLSHRYLWNPQAVDQLFADEQVTSLSTPGKFFGR